jgi:hypothetical protein
MRTDASDEFELGTLRPGAFVRRRELDQAGVAPAELDGGTLVFGGRTWRIEPSLMSVSVARTPS